MTLLKLQDVHVHYGHVHALKGISLAVERGEIVALIGANGAGKTTLLRAVSGLVRPSSGRIVFDGRDITGFPAHRLSQFGMAHVPEGRQVFSVLTVDENLTLGAYRVRDRATIEKARERVFALFPRLKERRRQLAGTLSGGEQQMLAIGRGLMSNPTFLLLDEPSLGLAPLVVCQIFDLIHEIYAQGITVLIVEQNARAVFRLAHRAYVMETGSIALEGKTGDLMSDPAVQRFYLGGEATAHHEV